MDLELAGKAAIVTGGSRGIGKAVARQLGREGVDLVLVARTLGPLQETATELSAETGRRMVAITADTSDDESVQAMVPRAAEALGHLDILVNCAAPPGGDAPAAKLAGVTTEDFLADMNVKAMGYLRCAREVAPYMQRQGWGRIINISGMAARLTGAIVTSMRNVAVVSLTKNLADELGPSGINVTAVLPAMTRTERTPGMIARIAEREGISPAEAEARMANGNSIHHLVDAREIADVVTFLASPRSIAIAGDAIGVAGGLPRAIYY